MVVDGLISLLNNEEKYRIVGFSNQPKEVMQQLEELDVHILLTDINMPEMTGVELTRCVKKKFPRVKVLALSMFGERQVIKEMIDAGVSGYILKNTGKRELIEALDQLVKGDTFFGSEVTDELMKSFKNADNNPHLTNREVEIIRLIENENSNKKIADMLFISERTVETHRKNIFRKTKIKGVIGLLKYAMENKLLD